MLSEEHIKYICLYSNSNVSSGNDHLVAQVPRTEWDFSVQHFFFLYWPLSQDHRGLEFKDDTLDTSFNLLPLGRKVNSLPFLFFPSHVILFSASVLDNITSSSLSPQNHTIHIVQTDFPKEISQASIRYFCHHLFFLSVFFFKGNNINTDKKHMVPNPSMQLLPIFVRAVEMKTPLLRRKYLSVLFLCNFLLYIRHKLSLKYQMSSWVEVSQTTIMWITNVLLW